MPKELLSASEETTPSLSQMQGWLRWIFTEPRGIIEALGSTDRIKSPSEPQPRLLPWVIEDPLLPVKDRLGIYSNAYFMRLLEVLGSNFPALKRTLGESEFRTLIADYLLDHPSTSPCIEDLGRDLPSFLKSHSFSKELGFLPDLADLEWMVLMALYTDRLPPLDSAAWSALSPDSWPSVRFKLDPTVHLMKVDYAVQLLWRDRLLPAKRGKHRLTGKNPCELLVYRDDDWVQVRSISQSEFFVLGRLRDGATLQNICDELQTKFISQGDKVSLDSWFSDWIRTGVIKEVQP